MSALGTWQWMAKNGGNGHFSRPSGLALPINQALQGSHRPCRAVQISVPETWRSPQVTLNSRPQLPRSRAMLMSYAVPLRYRAITTGTFGRNRAPIVEDGHNRTRVGDVVQRVGGQHDQVRAFTWLQRSARRFNPQQRSVALCGAYDGLHGCEPRLHHVFQFPVFGESRYAGRHSA